MGGSREPPFFFVCGSSAFGRAPTTDMPLALFGCVAGSNLWMPDPTGHFLAGGRNKGGSYEPPFLGCTASKTERTRHHQLLSH
jgi:hypothetical protein